MTSYDTSERFRTLIRQKTALFYDENSALNSEGEPGRQVVAISSQPGGRNSGKNGGKILFEKRKMKAKPHEKMNGKIILSRIRVNANEIAWKCRNERNAILSSFLVNGAPADMENLNR